MVKFYENSFKYEYSFNTVALAYFLRYPNPYSTHVISTDVISRHLDAATGRLHTVRLHLKRSKLPSAVLRLLPKSVLSSTKDGGSQTYILEESVVDVKEGWMRTTNRNLEWTGVLSVIEGQEFRRSSGFDVEEDDQSIPAYPWWASRKAPEPLQTKGEYTNVQTAVTLLSRLGQGRLFGTRGSKSPVSETEEQPKAGFFKALSTSSIQRSVETIGVRRAKDQLTKSREGMKIVLERLRRGGLVEVIDGMRHDRETGLANGGWKQRWGGSEPRPGNDID